ncbi:Transferase [Corchorus olitorius]|uniref:Transferase n=1 Tax=Corchorus olitorius TaxID=93759 RepID=A0A1R3HEQ4_9ROSI|nr:Transferase [Corchorus olitorius]
MEVHITSREIVQPSSKEVHLLKPFKLSYFDQLIPPHYVPAIFFFTKSSCSNGEILQPDLLEASSRLFPPIDLIPPQVSSSINSLWFKEGRYKTRTFVFDAEAISALMFKAKSKNLEYPSRSETLTAFIWKYSMLASRSASGIIKPSLITQAVNLRRILKPKLPDYSIGNLIWFTPSTYDSTKKEIELHELAYLLRQAVENFDTKFLESLQGDEGFKVISEQVNQIAEFALNENVEFYGFSSWLNFGVHEVDFGWGKPNGFRVPEVVTCALNNFTFLKAIGQHKAVEAWVTLDQKSMSMLEQNPEFLAFASLNPHYDKSKI